MWELKQTRVLFESSVPCPRGVGISMAQILSGTNTCLKNPEEYIRDMAGAQFIDVVFHVSTSPYHLGCT